MINDILKNHLPENIVDYVKTIKLIILDEADNLNELFQCALKRMIENYSKNNRFCLICNNLWSNSFGV